MEKIVNTLLAFLGMVEVAEKEADAGKDFTKMVHGLSEAQSVLTDWFNLSTLEGVTEADALVTQGCTVDAYNNIGELLSLAKVGQADRNEGDQLAARVKGMVAAELFDQGMDLGDWTAEKATELVTRWDATAPKKSRGPRTAGDSGTTTPDFAFPLVATCVKCKKVAAQEGVRTGHTYWNSLRHSAQKHNEKEHGGKFSAETAQGWKEAKGKVAEGAQSVTAGNYTISRPIAS